MRRNPLFPKLSDPSRMEEILLENPGKQFVLTGGVFDILKPFHIDLLEFAAALGDVLVAAVRRKGVYTPLEERLEILNELEQIHRLMVFDDVFSEKAVAEHCSVIVVHDEFQLAEMRPDVSGKVVKFPG